MAKGSSVFAATKQVEEVAGEYRRVVARASIEAELRVLAMQTKLHQWATSDPGRCFDDVFNLVYDPAFLVVAWSRVRGNKGARTAGIDGVTLARSFSVSASSSIGLRDDLKARRFSPVACP